MMHKFLLYLLPYKLVVKLTKNFASPFVFTTNDRQFKYWPIDEDHLLLQQEWEIKRSEKQRRRDMVKQNRKVIRAEHKLEKAERNLERQNLAFERVTKRKD